jgi:hypothetical protein
MFEEEAAPLVAADLAAGVEPGEIAEAAEPPAEAETETEAEPAAEADVEAPASEGEDQPS